ncbi:MAG: hypothetical protein ACXVZL_06705 [Gaiellaceae bacterium]
MRLRATLFAVVAALAAVLVIAPVAPAAPPSTTSSLTTPITGTVANGGTFAGTFALQNFTTRNGQLAAAGTLTGTLTDALGNVIGTVTNLPVTIPLAGSGSCQILHLTLGPLDLNLLGLQVHLNQVVLDITAQSGPGNLLGNLLCGVANLLNGSAPATTLANVLNHLLALL